MVAVVTCVTHIYTHIGDSDRPPPPYRGWSLYSDGHLTGGGHFTVRVISQGVVTLQRVVTLQWVITLQGLVTLHGAVTLQGVVTLHGVVTLQVWSFYRG